MKGTRQKILLGLLLCAMLVACTSITATTKSTTPEKPTTTEPTAPGADTAEDLVIPLSSLSTEPTFWGYMYGDTPMELIAVSDDGETVRLALNTCQSCGGSPYAWFEYLGDGVLQCQNCGLTFPLSTVGIAAKNGCNPVTVTEFTVENGAVIVPASLLAAESARFTNWKVFDE